MATKSQALTVARRHGFVLDESVSGKVGLYYMATFDHPTHSLNGDCRSIHDEDVSASLVWKNCIERMEEESPFLERCDDPKCEYHRETDNG